MGLVENGFPLGGLGVSVHQVRWMLNGQSGTYRKLVSVYFCIDENVY